jgi:hypothetical protein
MRAFFSFISVSVAAPTFDHGHATDEFRQPLQQFLAIVIGGRVLDLRPELLDATLGSPSSCQRP